MINSINQNSEINQILYKNKILEATTIEDCKKIAREHLNCEKYNLSDHQPLLLIAINSANPNLELVKSSLSKAIDEFPLDSNINKEFPDNKKQSFPSFHEVIKIEPDSLIDISYGGGLNFLNKFLNGESSGYAYEAGGKGIFVTVHLKGQRGIQTERDRDYAFRMAPKFYDNPAIMTAKIESQYLVKVNHNLHEAVILQENAKHIQKMIVKDLSPSLVSFQFKKIAFQQIIPDTGTYRNLISKGYNDQETVQLKQSWKEFTDVDLRQFGI